MHALVIGASGATGREIVNLLLADSSFCKVSVYVRRHFNLQHKKLEINTIEFSNLNKYKDLIKGDVLFSALGTTKKEAGSKKKQFLVDYTYQYNFAKIASENGVNHYSLISSVGANVKSSFFYPRIKGKLENSVKLLNFNKIQIFQAPLLIRQPELIRTEEKIIIATLKILNCFGFLKSFKPLFVKDLAIQVIAFASSKKNNRVSVYTPQDLFK